jgi:hypothetical protein
MDAQDIIAVDLRKSFTRSFTLFPNAWKSFDINFEINWREVDFNRKNSNCIPTESGIYCFAIKNKIIGIPNNSYLMYIGVAGHKKGSTRTLKDRYKEYLNESQIKRRAHIYYFLKKWKGHITYYYSALNNNAHNLLEIETKLCDAILPPITKRGYSSQVNWEGTAAWT